MQIIKYPDPRLKQLSEPVSVFDDKLKKLVNELDELMRSSPGGVGIAAPQVGIMRQIVIVDISAKPKFKNNGRMVLINPEISSWKGMEIGREGCMSVPDYTGNVIRAEEIELSACDENGELHNYCCSGYEARAVQHECDHLEGILFLDRLVSRRTDLFKRKKYK